MHNHSGKNFLLGAVIGGSLGALTVFLFATKKGNKLQKEILKHYHEVEQVAHDLEPKKRVKKALKTALKTAAKQVKKF